MLKVAICDDEQKDIDIAEKCILEYSFKHNLDIECANYRTGQELLDKMESGEHYDFFVFDVEGGWNIYRLNYPKKIRQKCNYHFCKQLPGTYGTELFCACI